MVELRSSSKPDQTSFYLDLQPRSCKCNLQRNLPLPLRTLRGTTKRGEKGRKKKRKKRQLVYIDQDCRSLNWAHLQTQVLKHGGLFLVVRTDVSSCEVLMSRENGVESWWRWRRRWSSSMNGRRNRCTFCHDLCGAPRTWNGSAPSVNRNSCSTVHSCRLPEITRCLGLTERHFPIFWAHPSFPRDFNCKQAKTALTTLHALLRCHLANQRQENEPMKNVERAAAPFGSPRMDRLPF